MAEKLLVVDDDAVFRQVLAKALVRRGYEVREAESVAEAEKLALAFMPQGAVVDMKLGDGSGLQLIPRLCEACPGIRILVLTGYAGIATAVEAIKLGAVNYLPKPAHADEIIAALQGASVSRGEVSSGLSTLTWEHIQQVLKETEFNISEAARRLGMHRRTLQRKLQKKPVK